MASRGGDETERREHEAEGEASSVKEADDKTMIFLGRGTLMAGAKGQT